MIGPLRQLLAAVRAPTPRRTFAVAPHCQPATSVVSLAIRATPVAACGAAIRHPPWRRSGNVLVVPDLALAGAFSVQREIAGVVARYLAPLPITIGLPPRSDRFDARRWAEVATATRGSVLRLGERGWDRVDLQPRTQSERLVDVAAEATDAGTLVLPVIVAGAPHVASAVLRVIHDHSVIRAALRRTPALAELLAAVDAVFIIAASTPVGQLVAVADDRIAAELLGQAIYRLAEQRRGVEARGPWESEIVQRLSELRLGVVLPSNLVIRADVPDNAAGYVQRLAELIGCRVEENVNGGRRE
jgi:hypothetical protein